ncbi:MAG: hypothetical protein ABI230_04435, partial [Aestuariivirga sp.]
ENGPRLRPQRHGRLPQDGLAAPVLPYSYANTGSSKLSCAEGEAQGVSYLRQISGAMEQAESRKK